MGMIDTRVVILLSELRPGGMERLVVHLANGLQTIKIPVLVLCLQDKGELAKEIKNSEKVVVALGSNGSKDSKAVWTLKKILQNFKPTIINIHDYSSLPYAVLSNLWFLKIPLMFTAHGLLYEGFGNLRKRYRFFSKFLAGFSAVSDVVANRHRSYLNWKKNIRVIPNGVPEIQKDNTLRNRIRSELNLDDHDIFFLAVGNPRPEKGFEDLIQAVVKLRSMANGNPRFKVAVAGKISDSKYCRMLLAAVKSESLQENIVFLGFRTDSAALYNAADIFVLSSRSEGLPMVILEAMTARLPVIATCVGGIPQAVGQAALLVEPKAPDALASAMYRLMTNPDKRDAFAQKGQALVKEKYSMGKMVAAYIQAYEDLAKIK